MDHVPVMKVCLQLFAEERTEPATPKRREEARKKGQVPRTGELGTALLLITVFFVLSLTLPIAARRVLAFSREFWSDELVNPAHLLEGQIVPLFVRMLTVTLPVVAPIIGAAMVVGLFSQVVQVGFMTVTDPLKPQLQRINPISGIKRLLSKRSLAELVKSVFKLVVITLVAWFQLRNEMPGLVGLAQLHPLEAAIYIGTLCYRTALWIGIALLVIAGFDYGFQRFEHEQNIKMTKKEVRDEMKETEGDPQIRSRIRQRQRQIAMMRMMSQVPQADVVITNPVHYAVALQYRPESMDAPVVIAKGAGPLAERIKSIARQHDIAIVEKPSLARALYESASVGEQIPEELYQAVAEVLAFVYRLRGKARAARL